MKGLESYKNSTKYKFIFKKITHVVFQPLKKLKQSLKIPDQENVKPGCFTK